MQAISLSDSRVRKVGGERPDSAPTAHKDDLLTYRNLIERGQARFALIETRVEFRHALDEIGIE